MPEHETSTRAPVLSFDSRFAAALSLTMVGGFVDAVGYIALFQIFTANMSGNSIHVGMYLGHMEFGGVARPACAIASYVTGMIVTRVAIESGLRRGVQRIATYTLAVEAALLLVFSLASPAMHLGQVIDLHSPEYFGMIALLGLAMGVQTATLTHSGPLTVYTTFVTGTLTKFSEFMASALLQMKDAHDSGLDARQVIRRAWQHEELRSAALLLATWLIYVCGAALGTLAKQHWEFRALLLPVGILLALIVLDRKRPISAREAGHSGHIPHSFVRQQRPAV